MPDQGQQDITGMLAAWNCGDTNALGRLMDLLYPELRRIAHEYLYRQRAIERLESAALANEAYLKLVRAGGIRCENRAHFLALCSQIIRRILVDHARRRGFAKHGGDALRVPLDQVLLTAQARGIEVLALDQALEALARLDGRKSRVVELRYFGGLDIEETAEVLAFPWAPRSAIGGWRGHGSWRSSRGNKTRLGLSFDAEPFAGRPGRLRRRSRPGLNQQHGQAVLPDRVRPFPWSE